MSERDDAQKVMRYDAERIVDEVIQERVDKAIYQLIGKRVKEATESLYDYVDNVVADIKTPNSPRGEVRYFGGSLIHNRQDANSIDFSQSATYDQGSLGLHAQGVLNVKDSPYNAKGDGFTDDTPNVQAAIDALSAIETGSAILVFPPGDYLVSSLTLKQGVILYGIPWMLATPWTTKGVRFTSNGTTGVMLDTPATVIKGCGVVGIGFQGAGAGTALKGVRFQNVAHGVIQYCTFNNFADEELVISSSSVACVVADNFGQNGLLNTTRSGVTGVCDIDGTDHHVHRNEFTASLSTVSSASLFCAAIVIRGADHECSGNIGEISDIGIYVSAAKSRFANDRADTNAGHGWQVVGNANNFATCLGLNNSQDTTNTYDNWNVTSASSRNQFAACRAHSDVAKVAKYGFNDLVTSDSTKNIYIAPYSFGAGTANYNTQSNSGSAILFARSVAIGLTANSATPSVEGYSFFKTANTTPTTITNFVSSANGQEIAVLCSDANTTIQHNGSTIITPNSGDWTLRNGVTYRLVKNGAWRLISEDPSLVANVTADAGDADTTLQYKKSTSTLIYHTAITAARAVNLSTTGAIAGAKFRVVRDANCTGGFNVNVGTGPLKALTAASQWVDVEYNGSAWVETATGSL